MRPQGHRLQRNESSGAPARHIALDTETRWIDRGDGVSEAQLRLGAACFWIRPGNRQPAREEWRDFTTKAEIWSWIVRHAQPRRRLVVWAMNVHFDLPTLGGTAELTERGFTITRAVIDRGRAIITARRGEETIELLDWYNFSQEPLEKTGERLGVPKLPMPAEDAPEDAWRLYCRQDVLVLKTAVTRWMELVQEHDLGYFGKTLGSQALHAYRHRFMPRDLMIPTQGPRAELERAAYMGGRVEAFRLGELPAGTYTQLDVNSAYPAVMRVGTFPRAHRWRVFPSSPADLERYTLRRCVVADVLVRTEVPIFPKRIDGYLCFPVGTFRTTLTTPEIREGLRRGAIIDVGATELYDGGEIFRRWVEGIWPIRQAAQAAGDPFTDHMIRGLLVALYGKFGQLRVDWETVGDEPGLPDEIFTEYLPEHGEELTYRRIGGRLQLRQREEEGWDAFPAIAAHVNAAARVLLWKYVEIAGREHVYYLDTDSLIVDEAGRAALEPYTDPARLGMLKVVGTSDAVRIDGAKAYTFGAKRVQKGRKRKAVDLPGGGFVQDEITGYAGLLRRRASGGPQLRRVAHHPRAQYRKGVVLPDGRIDPWRLAEDRRTLPQEVRDHGDGDRP